MVTPNCSRARLENIELRKRSLSCIRLRISGINKDLSRVDGIERPFFFIASAEMEDEEEKNLSIAFSEYTHIHAVTWAMQHRGTRDREQNGVQNRAEQRQSEKNNTYIVIVGEGGEPVREIQ